MYRCETIRKLNRQKTYSFLYLRFFKGSPYERLTEFKVDLLFHLLHINFLLDTSKSKSFEIQMKLSKNLCLKNCSSALSLSFA